MQPYGIRRRFNSLTTTGRVALFASVLAALALTVASAQTAINTPPQMPHTITVFPDRDFVAMEGYEALADLSIVVKRADAIVGQATGTTDAAGLLEVNHPGGVCWIDVTPDIAAGDVIEATYRDTPNNVTLGLTPGSGDALTTINVKAEQAVIVGDTVKVFGTAQDADGAPLPVDFLEQRVINPDFLDVAGSRIARRDIRADSAGGRVDGVPDATAFLAYDAPGSINWTATYTGLNEIERILVVEGQTRIMSWMAVDAVANRLGITISETGEVGGPGFGGCPAGPGAVVPPQPPDSPVPYNPASLLDPAAAGTDLAQLHEVVIFPERDFISVAGFAPDSNVQAVVRRPDVGTIGTARGIAGRSGIFEVNHPGGACWTGQTPDIRAGDIIDVFQFQDPDPSVVGDEIAGAGETQQTIDVTVSGPAFVDGSNNLIVRGTAQNPDGSPFDLASIEQRIINPDFRTTAGSRIARRDIRATSAGGPVDGIADTSTSLSYDAPGSANWTATYIGLNAIEQQVALAGQARAMAWLAADAAGNRFGLTIYEFGEVGGPGFGGCPQPGNQPIGAGPAATTTVINAPAVTLPASGVVTVTVNSASGTATGDVSLTVDGAAVGTQTLVNGSTMFNLSPLAAGTHNLAAEFVGNAAFVASSGTGSLVVNPALSITTTVISAPTVMLPASGVVTVTVSSAAGTPTGDVSLTVDGAAVGTQTLAGGSAAFTLPLAAGTHNLTADYLGNATFAPSSGSGSLVVDPAPSPTTTSISAPTVSLPASGSVTVTVTSGAGTPTGNVSLTVDGVAAGTQALGPTGSVTFTPLALAAGTHTLLATYAGNATFAPSSATGSLTVNNAATQTITVTAATATVRVRRTGITVSWSVRGTTTGVPAKSVVAVRRTSTGEVIGTGSVKGGGGWAISRTNGIVPAAGETVTASVGGASSAPFTVTIR